MANQTGCPGLDPLGFARVGVGQLPANVWAVCCHGLAHPPFWLKIGHIPRESPMGSLPSHANGVARKGTPKSEHAAPLDSLVSGPPLHEGQEPLGRTGSLFS